MPREEAKEVAYLEVLWTFINMLGLCAGGEGTLGLKFREPSRLRVLFHYYVIRIVVMLPTIYLDEKLACHVLPLIKHMPRAAENLSKCDEERSNLIQRFLFFFVMQVCFAHALYTLAQQFAEFPREQLPSEDLGAELRREGPAGLRTPFLVPPPRRPSGTGPGR
eukprot:CAMPEP_0180781220 /NCGR_PEP_ID=MMETSP1038_2-20121128/47516_1 /TAXON_ID=632150 /ORGANISM="Azadinium spinosum, Strain 3D9" /LENGTH=163 /DNA_ID=CAMNT_0022816991 /DNA_START=244 /DNA_END=732 /DNA_ORIENTATION=+